MKRFHLIGAVIAVFALAVVSAVPASAQERKFLLAEWLLNGVAIAANDTVGVAGELLLEDKSGPGGLKVSVLCSLIFNGWVGPNSLDYVSEVIYLNMTKTSVEPLKGTPLLCSPHEGCESTTMPEVWFVGLPWESEVELLEQENKAFFVDLVTGKGPLGWEWAKCLIVGIPEEEECIITEATPNQELELSVSTWEFTQPFTELAGGKFFSCVASSMAESGRMTGTLQVLVPGGGELAASSEGSIS